jgi:hypothetical protein
VIFATTWPFAIDPLISAYEYMPVIFLITLHVSYLPQMSVIFNKNLCMQLKAQILHYQII